MADDLRQPLLAPFMVLSGSMISIALTRPHARPFHVSYMDHGDGTKTVLIEEYGSGEYVSITTGSDTSIIYPSDLETEISFIRETE
jgi:hypothetical protein